MDSSPLTTTNEVIEALGGIRAVADLTGRKYPAAWHWSTWKAFPSDTYVVMTEALRAAGKTAPDSLWGMVESKAEERAAS
jgi:hypothetical protein